MSAKILVKYHSENSKPIAAANVGEWIDLKTANDTSIKAGESQLISMGVSIQVPAGFESILAPRSSTFKRYGLIQTNSIGVIDNRYCADEDIWMWPAYATRDIDIPAGTRLCQFRIMPIQPVLEIEEVEHFWSRARGGFGSTGI